MKVDANMKYTFQISARELTHIRHALNIAAEQSTGSKAKQFGDIHNELTTQVKNSLNNLKTHFEAMVTLEIKGLE